MTRAPHVQQDRVARWLQDALPGHLPAFLARQRWYGGKARPIGAIAVEDIALWGDEAPSALVIAAVSYEGGSSERYGLLVGFDDEPGGRAVIGPTAQPGLPAWAVEATVDPARVGSLLKGFSGAPDHPTRLGGRLRYLDVSETAKRAVAEPTTVTPVGSEQSNTSMRVGASLVFKLFRRLPVGENPEVEMGRFLTSRTSFRATPALHGSLAYGAPDGTTSTLGVLQAWVPCDGDGWAYVTSHLQRALRDASVSDELARAMVMLGGTTADFHAALASDVGTPAFRPEAIGEADIGVWRGRFADQASRTIDLVRRHHLTWADEARRLAGTCLEQAGHMAALGATGGRGTPTQLWKTRIHGDYHLGQTLKTPAGFTIIDFEGEPSRPIDERRQKHSPLRDVAGMLRSFDYAIETAGRHHPAASSTLRSSLNLRESFLAGYLATVGRADVTSVPRDRGELEAWLGFFEFEKALYELEYEINNRPAWVDIPLRWIVRSLEDREAL
jgi:maltose alpha-D-glucosyltransferase/alpha-amylase